MGLWEPLSELEMKSIVDFANGSDDAVDIETVRKFNRLHSAVENRLLETLNVVKTERGRLARQLERFHNMETAKVEAGDFKDLGLDSVDVAFALLYLAQQAGLKRFTRTKLLLILYEIYASWLFTHHERLFIEHPVAYEFGPWFWRVASRVANTYTPVSKAYLDNIFAINSGVGVVLQRAIAKYGNYEEHTLVSFYMKSEPYRKCTKDKNGGKWNKELSDVDIFHWKSGLMGK